MGYYYLRAVVFVMGILVLRPQAFAQVAPQTVGTIQGISIGKEEVQREMRKYRAEVYSLIADKNATTKAGTTFWEQQINGVKAIDILRKKAIDSLAIIKVQEKLLVERGLWPYKDYDEFLTDLKNNNENRRKQATNNQVIYGPVEYSEQTFFDYRFNNALILLKQKLVAENLITVTDNDLQNKFEELQKNVYKDEKYTLKAFTRQVRDAYIEDVYKTLINQYSKKAKRNINLVQLNQITLTN